MAHSQETRRALRSAYVYKAQSLEACAQQFNIAYSTAAKWKKESLEDGDDWEKARAAALLSSQGHEAVSQAVLEQFVTLFQSTLEQLKTDTNVSPLSKAEAISRLSDAYNKTMSAVGKNNPKLNKLAVAMEVLNLQANFIREQYPHLAASFSEMLGHFGERITEAFA